MRIHKKLAVGFSALTIAAGVSMTGAGSASAVDAHDCGSSTSPILVSHPISLTVDGTTPGRLDLGYFGDYEGVYAETHWQYGPSSPPGEQRHPELTVYRTNYKWQQSTRCANNHIWGNWHTFSDGGWGSGRYGGCN
jgi:hypothetical protein